MSIKTITRNPISVWDLSEIIGEPTKKNIAKKQKLLHTRAEKFAKQYRDVKSSIHENKFCKALDDTNNLYEDAKSISGYAMLKYSENVQSGKASALVNSTSNAMAEVENKTLFFDLWWQKSIDAKNVKRLLASSGNMKDYLTLLRQTAKYSLGESEEKIINILDTTGQFAMIRLYDKITSGFTYSVGRKKNMTREQVSILVRSPNAQKREAAYKQILGKYEKNIGVLGDIYQNIVARWENIGVKMRGYSSPISIRNISNDMDDQTSLVLLDVCAKNRGVFYDYFKIKAKYTNHKKLHRYDLYAPIAVQKNEKKYQYNTAVKMVQDSLHSFSPKLSKWATSVFDANHVDSQPRIGKKDGAFCATIRPDILPYILLSYTGRLSDVFTLSHEMGHAIHAIAASDKPALVQEASLPLAETASTFSEMLLYENISKSISDSEKAHLLAEKIADWYATIMRQSYFTIFENSAHQLLSNGGTVEDVSSAYMKNLQEQFGNAVSLSEDFGSEWSCIPHFYHAPFYCYAYSFGNLLALALYRRYKKEGDDFVSQYIEILSGGGSRNPKDLLQEHGIDINSRKFWQGGFDHIKEQISDLRKLV